MVADPLADSDPWLDAAIDWDTTIAFRRHLWSLGLGVAEAMDTAQRGMGMDWPNSLELIRRSLDAAKDFPGALIGSGAGTDHLAPGADVTVDDVIRAYEEQCAAVEKLGGRIILMASRALVKAARSPDDYAKVYARILDQVKEPVIIHWLGEMFDPALDGYWGHKDHMKAMEVALDVIASNPAKVDGVKISLLDKDKEIAMRRRLPQGVRMYTGDDFNYAELIAGDAQGYSDALLGIFDAIAPAASAALGAFTRGDVAVVPRNPRADGAAVAPHLQGADPLLQDRRGVHGLSQRPAGPLHHGRRPGEHALDLASCRAVPARRCRGAARRSGACGRSACSSSWRRAGSRLMRDLSKRPLAARDQLGDGEAVDAWSSWSRAACAPASPRIAPWRDIVQAAGVEKAGNMIRAAGLTVTCLCRAGLFPAADEAGRRAALDDNRRAVDEAAAIGARCLVLIAGGLPKGSKDLAGAQRQVRDGIAALLPHARDAGVPLAIEPLHPMYAADRACVNTLAHANDLCDQLGEGVGVAVDVYHVWWDPDLPRQIARAGKRILTYHVCDWLVPTSDLLLDRGMPGDGVIDLRAIRAMVEATGYDGHIDVEIFSAQNWWKREPAEVLRICLERHQTVV